jgi:hypothetical protein
MNIEQKITELEERFEEFMKEFRELKEQHNIEITTASDYSRNIMTVFTNDEGQKIDWYYRFVKTFEDGEKNGQELRRLPS